MVRAPEQRLSLMYYPDLTPYCYLERESASNVLNVGWLDIEHPFPKRKASEELLDVLFETCRHVVIQTRGFHECELCDVASFGVEVSRNGQTRRLGSAEIRVKGKDGIRYAAPDLIYHYVAEHDYDPPKEFVEAVLQRSILRRIFGILRRLTNLRTF